MNVLIFKFFWLFVLIVLNCFKQYLTKTKLAMIRAANQSLRIECDIMLWHPGEKNVLYILFEMIIRPCWVKFKTILNRYTGIKTPKIRLHMNNLMTILICRKKLLFNLTKWTLIVINEIINSFQIYVWITKYKPSRKFKTFLRLWTKI